MRKLDLPDQSWAAEDPDKADAQPMADLRDNAPKDKPLRSFHYGSLSS